MAEAILSHQGSLRGSEDNGDSFRRSHDALLHSVPPALQQATSTHASTGDSWTLPGKSGSVSCGVTAPFSWVLVHTDSVCALQESVSPVPCKFWWLYGGVNGDLLQEGYAIPRSAALKAPAFAVGHC